MKALFRLGAQTVRYSSHFSARSGWCNLPDHSHLLHFPAQVSEVNERRVGPGSSSYCALLRAESEC